VRIINNQVRIFRLLVRYFYLHVRYVQLHVRYYLLRAAGAALVEAAKIECRIKSLSKEDCVIFATCMAVSIYALALVVFIRI